MAFNDVPGMQPRICVCVHLYAYASSVHSCAWVFVRKLCTHALALSDAGVCADEPPSREIMMILPLGALPSHRSAVLCQRTSLSSAPALCPLDLQKGSGDSVCER